MTYKQKLIKIGNSVGLIIPKALLDSLNLDVETELYVANIQDKIVIEKEPTTAVSPEFLK